MAKRLIAWWRGPHGFTLAGVVATTVVLAVIATATMLVMYDRGNATRQASIATADLVAHAEAVRSQPLEFEHGAALPDDAAALSRRHRDELRGAALRLEHLAPGDTSSDISAAVDRLNRAIGSLYPFLARGDLAAAVQQDESAIKPAHARLMTLLSRRQSQLDRDARHDRRVAIVAMLTIDVVLAAVTTVMTSTYGRSRRREGSVTAEHESLLASEQRFRALVQHSSDATMVLDHELVIRYATPAVESILGRRPEDLVGLSLADFIQPDDLERTLATAGYPHTARGQSGRAESRWRHVDGSWHVVESAYTDRLDDPTIEGYVVNARDITKRAQLERELQQSQKLESVGQLASGIAHEINTPVQFVGDNLRFFREGFDNAFAVLDRYRTTLAASDLPDAERAAVATLEAEAEIEYFQQELPAALAEATTGVERIATIVRAMRSFGHPDGKDQAPVDLNECIDNTLTVARNELKYVADVRTELSKDLPPVTCFRGDVNQVLLNLLVNAAHAIADRHDGPDRRGTITVRSSWSGDEAVVSVTDTGCGIPDEYRHRVFDQFFTTKEVGRGTGQGLAIAHTLITNRHHGTLTFESEVGSGTTFTIRLPISGVNPAVGGA